MACERLSTTVATALGLCLPPVSLADARAGSAADPGPIVIDCRIGLGGKHDRASARLCDAFDPAFKAALKGRNGIDRLLVTLTRPRASAIEVAVRGLRDDRQIVVEPFLIEVMDRPLAIADAEKLARLAAEAVLKS